MSFFIRKKSKNFANLTKPAGQGGGGGGGRDRPRNTDYKPRPTSGSGINRKKPFGGKRSQSFGKGEGEKRPRFDKNEEIESSSSEEDDGEGLGKLNKLKRSDESHDEFYSAEEDQDVEEEDEEETAQEKKLRLAKLYLEEIAKQEARRREDAEEDPDAGGMLGVASRLKEDVLESEGRLRREIADRIEPDLEHVRVLSCSRYLKRSVTCLCITEDDSWIFSGSKDGHIFKWSVAGGARVGMIKKKEALTKRQKKKRGKKGNPGVTGVREEEDSANSFHSSTITAIAISSDGKYLASGDEDGKIVIWNPESLKKIHIFTGHRGGIRGLTFRKKKHTLYSSSTDRSVRVWCLDAMGYVESLFGHQDAVTCIDALTRERVVTGGGRDATVRVWKIVEESQLVYNGHPHGGIEAVKLINEENFLSCGDDGFISSWNVNRKKPLFTLEQGHGSSASFPGSEYESPRWISALAAETNSDLFASGSCDGFIRLWKAGERFKSISPAGQIPVQGWINALAFSSPISTSTSGSEGQKINVDLKRPKFLVAGTGKEHRLGRWFGDFKSAKNSIVIIPLKWKSSQINDFPADDAD